MSAEHWDSQAQTMDAARAAVWSEPLWALGIEQSIDAIMSGMSMRFMGISTNGGFQDSAGFAYSHRAHILEIGCGIGRILIPLARRFPYATFYGQDISPMMLQLATQREATANVSWWLNDIPDVNFDAVYSMLVFQHLPAETVRDYIAKVARQLIKGGAFRFQFVEGGYSVDHDHRHSLNDVATWLEEAGLSIVAIDAHLVHFDWTWVTAVKQ